MGSFCLTTGGPGAVIPLGSLVTTKRFRNPDPSPTPFLYFISPNFIFFYNLKNRDMYVICTIQERNRLGRSLTFSARPGMDIFNVLVLLEFY